MFITLLEQPSLYIFSFATFFVYCICKVIRYYKRLPPGPWGIPILGYLPFVAGRPPHSLYYDLAAKYGDVFSVKLGTNLIIGVSCPKLVRELFNRPDSTRRPNTPLGNLLRGLGIMSSEGELWKRQRTFLHEKFRALGVKLCPNARFERYVAMELDELFTILAATEGRPINPRLIFGRHLHNIICQLMMSFRFEEGDQEFVNFNENVARGMKLYGMVHTCEHFRPYLYLPGKKAVLREIKKNLHQTSQFHKNHFARRVSERSSNPFHSEPADLLDFYIDRVEKERRDPRIKGIFPNVKPEDQIIQTMNDLFSAGMETSLATILWIMVMMVREPAVANKVRRALREVVGVGQLVTMEHRLALPYVEAVVFETIRYISLVPLGTVHVNEAEWNVKGVTIPAGSLVIPLIQKMNMDPKVYKNPDIYYPERFIRNGKCNLSEYYQFGVGQRICLGNMLARMELFLFFANLMNTFEFSLPEGAPMPGLEGSLGSTHTPNPYELCYKKINV